MSLKPLTGAKRLRELLKDPKHLIICPGVFDCLTTRLALATGFEALYMTGAGTSISRLGWADLGIATLDTMEINAEMIASLDPSVPVIADADIGYGGPIMVSRSVTQYSRAGVAALHIEDQAQQTRCGHLLGKVIVDREEYYVRLRAAVMARDQIHSDMLIIARTDANQTYGFEEAMERLSKAVEIGVDIVFFEALASEEEARKAKEIGFRIMIMPGICMSPVIRAVTAELEHLKENGSVSEQNHREGVIKAFNLCGLQECIEIDRAAGGVAYDSVGNS